jgi:DNA mismatch endonuclease, patch repair protein
MDSISRERRTANMAAIRSANTKPEMLVRRFLHQNGLRYRLHSTGLPGKPDIVFPSRRIAVFVHGCFWHGCRKCIDGRRKVRSNADYWSEKICRNRKRDRLNVRALRKLGWNILTIWECEIATQSRLAELASSIKAAAPQRSHRSARS